MAVLLSRRVAATLPHGRSVGDAEPERGVVLGAAGFAPAPAEGPGIAPEESRRLDLGLVHRCRAFGVGGDVERIGRAIDLAQEAGLTVGLAGDDRWPLRQGVENVGRADLDAHVAGDAPARGDDLDHGATAIGRPSARAT